MRRYCHGSIVFLCAALAAVALLACGCLGEEPLPEPGVHVTEISATSGVQGSELTLTGVEFGDKQGDSSVMVGDKKADVVSWGQNEIKVKVPEGLEVGKALVYVKKDGEKSEQYGFIVLDANMSQSPYGAVLSYMAGTMNDEPSRFKIRLAKTSQTDPDWQQYEVTLPDGTVSPDWVTVHKEDGRWVVKTAEELKKEGPQDLVNPEV